MLSLSLGRLILISLCNIVGKEKIYRFVGGELSFGFGFLVGKREFEFGFEELFDVRFFDVVFFFNFSNMEDLNIFELGMVLGSYVLVYRFDGFGMGKSMEFFNYLYMILVL